MAHSTAAPNWSRGLLLAANSHTSSPGETIQCCYINYWPTWVTPRMTSFPMRHSQASNQNTSNGKDRTTSRDLSKQIVAMYITCLKKKNNKILNAIMLNSCLIFFFNHHKKTIQILLKCVSVVILCFSCSTRWPLYSRHKWHDKLNTPTIYNEEIII